jgi:hypothetical protein
MSQTPEGHEPDMYPYPQPIVGAFPTDEKLNARRSRPI